MKVVIDDAFSSLPTVMLGTVIEGHARVRWRGSPPPAELIIAADPAAAVDQGQADAGATQLPLFLIVSWGSGACPATINRCIGWLGANRPKFRLARQRLRVAFIFPVESFS